MRYAYCAVRGLGCDRRPNRACPLPAPSLLRWRRAGSGGHAGYTEMFQNCAAAGLYWVASKSGDGVFKWLLNEDFLAEALTDPAYTHRASVVRDMRKSSVFKRGRFPDAQC